MIRFICLLLVSLPLSLLAQEGKVAVEMRYFPVDSRVWIDGVLTVPDGSRDEYRLFYLSPGAHHFRLEARDYRSESFPVHADKGTVIEGKQERLGLPVSLEGELSTARQPKSVTFSPDGEFLAVASLGSTRGLQIFTVEPFAHLIDLVPPETDETGFVESAWLPERGEVWVSQMNTGEFHIFDTESWEFVGSFDAGGDWSKVIAVSADESRAYISHWESRTVTEVDVDSRRVLRSFGMSGVPRGMSLSPDGRELLVTIFTANALDKIDLDTGRVTTTSYGDQPGAMRHLVADRERHLYYVTNMLTRKVYAISDVTGKAVMSYNVGFNPNTAEMSPDGHYLFVSCRGRNNRRSYLYEGPEHGQVYIIDCENETVLGWIWGRDQTTGLDVSPDSSYLAFTDFKDDNLELYRIEEAK